jgi:hypothetical protein
LALARKIFLGIPFRYLSLDPTDSIILLARQPEMALAFGAERFGRNFNMIVATLFGVPQVSLINRLDALSFHPLDGDGRSRVQIAWLSTKAALESRRRFGANIPARFTRLS